MNNKGIALIMAVGVLALLAIIATSFALNMRLEYHAAVNYYNGVKARYFAEAALERAIAELRAHVRESAFDDLNEDWWASGYQNANIEGNIDGRGTSGTTFVYDEQRKININNANALLLTNILSGFAVDDASVKAGDIVSGRSAGDYRDTHELMSRGNLPYVDFAAIKDVVTACSYEDANTGLAPININTADEAVVAAVLNGIVSNDLDDVPVNGAMPPGKALNVARIIIDSRPFRNWQEFDTGVDAAIGVEITASEATIIKYNCNPNRPKPTTHTTEFCFNSGGYYNIVARGIVNDFLGAPQADRTLNATVKIYGIYCETEKEQFELGTPVRVTWLDSCPVNSTDLFGQYGMPSNAPTIENSIKLGFWDDFSDVVYTNAVWKKVQTESAEIMSEMWYFWNWAKYQLGQDAGQYAGYSNWTNYSTSLYERDNAYNPNGAMKDVGWIFVKGMVVGDPAILHARSGKLEWGPLTGTKYAYHNPSGAPGEVIFLSDAEAQGSPYFFNPATDKYLYPSQIRIFRYRSNSSVENYDTSTFRQLFTYDTTDRSRKYNILLNGTNLAITVYPPSGAPGTFSVSDINSGSGVFGLYAQANNVWWDNIRLISPDGNFTSQALTSLIVDPTHGSAGADVVWGTITGTLTHPDSSVALRGDVGIATSIDSFSEERSLSDASPFLALNGATANSLQYKAILTQNVNDSNMHETPVLEDVTVTYLPKVSIKSFSLSN